MVPLNEYAVVSQDADLHTAIIALQESQAAFSRFPYRHRAILVLDENQKVIGKLSMFDILEALEPRYQQIEKVDLVSRHGVNLQFLESTFKDNMLWNESFQHYCSRAKHLKVKNNMVIPDEGFYIDENASLGEAIHRIVVPKQNSLLVTRDDTVVGVLRLSDVFDHICSPIAET